jgi:hypothetical protein
VAVAVVNVDTCEFAALRDEVDSHARKHAHTEALFNELFDLMRDTVRAAGLSPLDSGKPALQVLTGGAQPGRRARPRGHLLAVKDGRP